MNANNYQKQAARTLIDAPDRETPPRELAFVIAALELAIKAGSIVEKLKKDVFHQRGLTEREIIAKSNALSVEAGFLTENVEIALDKIKAINTLPDFQIMLLWNLAGLIGEASEIAALILNGDPEDRIADELGDLSWYQAAIATKRGLKLADILGGNIAKLEARYPSGYNAEDSQARKDEQAS